MAESRTPVRIGILGASSFAPTTLMIIERTRKSLSNMIGDVKL